MPGFRRHSAPNLADRMRAALSWSSSRTQASSQKAAPVLSGSRHTMLTLDTFTTTAKPLRFVCCFLDYILQGRDASPGTCITMECAWSVGPRELALHSTDVCP